MEMSSQVILFYVLFLLDVITRVLHLRKQGPVPSVRPGYMDGPLVERWTFRLLVSYIQLEHIVRDCTTDCLDIMIFVSSRDVVIEIGGHLTEIFNYITEYESYFCQMDPSGHRILRLLMNSTQADKVMERGGHYLNNLEERYQGQVEVLSTCCPRSTERVLAIRCLRSQDFVNLTIWVAYRAQGHSPQSAYIPSDDDTVDPFSYGGFNKDGCGVLEFRCLGNESTVYNDFS